MCHQQCFPQIQDPRYLQDHPQGNCRAVDITAYTPQLALAVMIHVAQEQHKRNGHRHQHQM